MAKQKETVIKDSIKDNIKELRFVFPKTMTKMCVQPARDSLGNLPSFVREVDKSGYMILKKTDEDSSQLVAENTIFDLTHGMIFNLNNPADKRKYDCIKNNVLIATERCAKDEKNNFLIDGEKVNNKNYQEPVKVGFAKAYWYTPGKDITSRIEATKLRNQAEVYVFESTSAINEGICRLYGIDLHNFTEADRINFLLGEASANPSKLLSLYTDSDMNLRLMIEDALIKTNPNTDSTYITMRDKLFYYDDTLLGNTKEAVILFLKQSGNRHILDMIKKDLYPDSVDILN